MLALLALQSLEVMSIATLTIRGLDPDTHARLRVEAARHGRSMEAEVRAILQERLASRVSEHGLGTRIRDRFAGLEGQLEIPARSDELPRAAVFDE
jgi:antitoxin FitA